MVNLTVDTEGMDDILNRLAPEHVRAATQAMLNGLTRLLLRFSMVESPVLSGDNRRSGFMQIDGDGQSAIVGFGKKYSGVIEAGSQAHEINAVNAQTLAFVPRSFSTLEAAQSASEARRGTGTTKSASSAQELQIFPTHVFHPGTVANPFMQRGLVNSEPEMSSFIVEVGGKWMRGDVQDEDQ